MGENADVAIEGPWKRGNSVTGSAVWRLNGNEVPASLTLAQAPVNPLTAYVQYDSASQESAKLEVKIERKLFRMVADSSAASGEGTERTQQYNLTQLGEDEAVKSNELYLEEITLTPENGVHVRYGLIESPLPPGAEVEGSTWGISVANGVALERARNEPSRGGYAVPLERVDEHVVVRHLLRYSQKGKYSLPPARFYSMYAPQNKAQEAAGKTRVVTVK